ncbi:Fc.00g034760.m01.CDS01 [Cosmosporella sp. VM-42]
MESFPANAMNNGSVASQGFIADLIGQRSNTTLIVTATVLASASILPLLNKLLTPAMDPREPPLIKPSIPLIGHIIGIIKHQSDYHRIVHDCSNAHPSLPIATLQMLNGKLYTIFDPHLIQPALRSKIASFEPFVTEFARKTFGLSDETFEKITSNPAVVPEFTDAIHASFQTESLHKMNVHFLGSISAKMGPLSCGLATVDETNTGKEKVDLGGLEVENLFLWCRDVMTLATTKALYGNHDPFNQDQSLVDMIWIFEESVPYFLLSLFPALTMPKAYRARGRLQKTMSKYYSDEHEITDPTTSTLVFNRANSLRKHKFTGEEIGLLESILPIVATINAVPTFYWMLLFIFERPELVERLRIEVEEAATVKNEDSERIVTFNIAEFDDKLPLLISCYREAMRLANHSVSSRRIMTDMTVTGSDGQSYLLKKGVDLQLPAGVTHYEQSIWGDDAATFNPERFLPPTARDKTAEGLENERKRKAGYFPFGGGRHLCPGRNFAFAEILGFMSVLVLGFEVEPTGMRFGEMQMLGPQLASGTVKPKNSGKGLGAKIRRRSGWEGVQWKFEC